MPALIEPEIVTLGDLDAAMSQQQGNIFQGSPRQQFLNREGVPEHVRMATNQLVVPLQLRRLEDVGQTSPPSSNGRDRLAVSGPEEVCLAHGRDLKDRIGHLGRHSDEHRVTVLLSMKQDEPDAVFLLLKPKSLEAYAVDDG